MLEIYKRIKIRRKELGMSQETLANAIGYSGKSMVSKIERGEINLPQSKIVSIAKALDISPSDLLGDEGCISDVEGELLTMFRQLNEQGKDKAMEYMSDLIDSGKYKKHRKYNVVEKEA